MVLQGCILVLTLRTMQNRRLQSGHRLRLRAAYLRRLLTLRPGRCESNLTSGQYQFPFRAIGGVIPFCKLVVAQIP